MNCRISVLVLCVSFFCFQLTLAQDTMQYGCYLEKQNIGNYLKHKQCDSFAAFYFIDNRDTISYGMDLQRCNDFADKYIQSGMNFHKEKNLKKLLEAIHKEFLIKYEIRSQFYQIFRKGTYNCVTSSALYGLILRRMGIPFLIKELTTHVYLTVQLGNKELDVETTLPQDLVPISKKQKKAYVKELEKSKQVTHEEIETKGIEKIFDEKYYQSKTINLRQLAGLSYFNMGLLLYDSSKKLEALEVLRISRNLYPRANTNLVIGSFLDNIQNQQTQFNPMQLLREQLKYSDMYDKETLARILSGAGVSVLFRDGRVHEFTGIDSFINTSVIREYAKLKELRYTYAKIMGEYYMKTKDYVHSFYQYKTAYTFYNTDVDARYNLILAMREYFTLSLKDTLRHFEDSIVREMANINALELDEEYLTFRNGVLLTMLLVNNECIAQGLSLWPELKWQRINKICTPLFEGVGLLLIKKNYAVAFTLCYAWTLNFYGDKIGANAVVQNGLKKFPGNESLLTLVRLDYHIDLSSIVNNLVLGTTGAN